MTVTVDVAIYVLQTPDARVSMTAELNHIKNNFPIENFNFDLKGSIEIPQRAYNRLRDQYNGSVLLELLPAHAIIRKGQIPRTLGITPVNLYVEGLNFIFGLSEINGLRCIVSTYMLLSTDDTLYLSRVLKEVVHELGHTFGLRHCRDAKCVMHFSNTLMDTDIKSHEFCKDCMKKVRKKLESSVF